MEDPILPPIEDDIQTGQIKALKAEVSALKLQISALQEEVERQKARVEKEHACAGDLQEGLSKQYSKHCEELDAKDKELAEAVGWKHLLTVQLSTSENLRKEQERLLGLFADLDCCDGYTLSRDEYPKLWDALNEARRVLGRGPEEKQTEKRKCAKCGASDSSATGTPLLCHDCDREQEWQKMNQEAHGCVKCAHLGVFDQCSPRNRCV